MYDPLSEHPSDKHIITELFDSRGSKFNYVDRTRRSLIKHRAIWFYLLNSLASCLALPVLVYISFHGIKQYLNDVTRDAELLSALFYAITLSLFLDFLIGYLYDKLLKAELYPIKAAFNIIGTIGLIITVAFLFRHDVTEPEALKQFRWTVLVFTVCYTLCNTNSFKNSSQFTPSQEDRTRLIYVDYIIKGFFTLFFVCLPYWIKFWSDDCTCGATCSADSDSQGCFTCLEACDNFTSNKIFRDVALGFTCLFGVANIVSEFLVHPRVDEEVEHIETTINRRISELFRNGVFVKTFFLIFLQTFALFGFAFWANYYLDDRNPPTDSCTSVWGTAAYLCTKSWMKTLTFLILFIFIAVGWLISEKRYKWLKNLAFTATLIPIIAGLLTIIIQSSQGVLYTIIVLLMTYFFATLPPNELLYTDAMYYDEYLSGSNQTYLTSSLYHLAVKCGFFIAAAFHITLYRANGTATETDFNINSDGFGAITIVVAVILFLIGWRLNKYDFNAFDKVQLAIERNQNDTVEGFVFYDPIAKNNIRRPITSHDENETTLIALLYNLDPRDDLKLAVAGRYSKLRSNALIRIILFAILLFGFTVIVIVFSDYLDTRYGWFLLIALIVLPISLYGMLYNYNVWATAVALDSSKYKGTSKLLLSRFSPLVEEHSVKQPIV